MKTMKFLFAAMAVTLLLMTGCQPAATPAPTAAIASAPQATQVVAPTVSAASAAPTKFINPRKIVLGFSPPTFEMTDFYKLGQRGLEDEAAALGLNLTVIAKAPSTHAAADDQLRIIEDFITQKVDYIWVVPVSAEAGTPMYAAAAQAGIPIFVGHNLIDNPASLHIINVGTDFIQAGTDVGNWIADKLNCTGPVGMIRGAAGDYDTQRVISAINAIKVKCPNLVVYASDYTDWSTEQSITATKTLLTAHPDLKLIYDAANPLTLGTAQALDEMGLTGKIQVLDYDMVPATQALCPEGKIVGGLAMFPFEYGHDVADLIAAKEAGNTIPDQVKVPGRVVTCDQLDTVFPSWYRDLAKALVTPVPTP
jgi:ribose transport system substrate-binding protein